MNRGYVLDRAGVEAINRAISRVGNTPPAMLDTNRRHRITVTEGGGYEYNGYFKVVETTDESGKAMLKIIDGADPKSNYAGSTDLGYVPVMSIAKQTGQLYLLPEWKVQNDTRVYSFYLRYNIDPGEIRKAVKIASILGDGTIVQRHVTNEILWGNRFFV